MSYKLIMYWDIKPGRDQEYFEFIVREPVDLKEELKKHSVKLANLAKR